MTSQYFGNSIFWIEVDKIKPNPFQPRQEFDSARLNDLAESIRTYGVLQPLVVTRRENVTADGGLSVEYELISGERRLRASKLAGVAQVPVIIRSNADDDRVKLELAIIENLQREDLNPIDRARAFQRLIDEFHFKHVEIAEKVGKSREYVSNSIRLLTLPGDIIEMVQNGRLTEGHARPLMMLARRPKEQQVLFKEILFKNLSVRDTEGIARRIATERARRPHHRNPEIATLEEELTESLGTRVQIEEKGESGGRIHIDFFSPDDVRTILRMLKTEGGFVPKMTPKNDIPATSPIGISPEKGSVLETSAPPVPSPSDFSQSESGKKVNLKTGIVTPPPLTAPPPVESIPEAPENSGAVDDRSREEKNRDENSEEEMYSIKNFSI